MVTRVIGIPDKDGIIRISCGGDIIEIVVGGSGGGPTASAPRDDENPFDRRFANIVREIESNPFDLPGTYLNLEKPPGGQVDLADLVDRYLRQMRDSMAQGPIAVVLAADRMDLHEISDLGRQIDRAMDGIPLAIDFGRAAKSGE
jgi:hypothetical protein